MERTLILLIGVIIFTGQLIGQEQEEIDEFGFIDIKTDSMNVPFFVDGFYVGNHPVSYTHLTLPTNREV